MKHRPTALHLLADKLATASREVTNFVGHCSGYSREHPLHRKLTDATYAWMNAYAEWIGDYKPSPLEKLNPCICGTMPTLSHRRWDTCLIECRPCRRSTKQFKTENLAVKAWNKAHPMIVPKGSSSNLDQGVFNEQVLRNDIKRTWGEGGAHMEVYDHLLRRVATFEEVLTSIRKAARVHGLSKTKKTVERKHRPR